LRFWLFLIYYLSFFNLFFRFCSSLFLFLTCLGLLNLITIIITWFCLYLSFFKLFSFFKRLVLRFLWFVNIVGLGLFFFHCLGTPWARSWFDRWRLKALIAGAMMAKRWLIRVWILCKLLWRHWLHGQRRGVIWCSSHVSYSHRSSNIVSILVVTG
jgi:hypothetical protein